MTGATGAKAGSSAAPAGGSGSLGCGRSLATLSLSERSVEWPELRSSRRRGEKDVSDADDVCAQ